MVLEKLTILQSITTRVGQKISTQCTYSFFIFRSNKASSHFPVVRSHYFPHSSCHNSMIILWDKLFYSPLNEVRVLCYQPSGRNCFHLAIIFKCVAAQILFRRGKHMITIRRCIPQYNRSHCTRKLL